MWLKCMWQKTPKQCMKQDRGFFGFCFHFQSFIYGDGLGSSTVIKNPVFMGLFNLLSDAQLFSITYKMAAPALALTSTFPLRLNNQKCVSSLFFFFLSILSFSLFFWRDDSCSCFMDTVSYRLSMVVLLFFVLFSLSVFPVSPFSFFSFISLSLCPSLPLSLSFFLFLFLWWPTELQALLG